MKAELRLKDLGIFKTGLTYSPDNLCEPNEGVLVLRSANIQNDKIDLNDCAYVNNKIDSNMYIRKGDILICSRNGSANLVGKTAIIEKDMNATWGAFMMLLRTRYNSNYINYLLNATIRKEKGRFATSTINQLTNSMLGGIHVDIFTERVEQQKIVDYLDEKTSAIETQVKLLEKKKDAYTRLKKAMINRAVTRGLDEHVRLKDSGVEWIGMIPEHWERFRLKDLGYMYSGLTGKSGDDFRCDDETQTKPYVPFTNVLNNTVVDNDNFHNVVLGEKEQQNQVKAGDLLFLMSSEDYESIAKSAVVLGNPGEVYLNSFCRGLRITNHNCYTPFLNYQLNSEMYRDALRFEARGFTRINIKIDRVASHFVSLPPFSEQQTIADYLDEKCAKIDAAIANIDKQTDALKRLKRSLINEVISGKRMIE